MAEVRSGLHKKVSSIFDGAPVPKAVDGQQKAILPLLGQDAAPKTAPKEGVKEMNINLIRFRKNGEQKVIALPSAVTVIGRRHSCDLCIPLDSISKKHCQLNCDEGTLKIRDLGSRNGTFLNGKRVNESAIEPGDCVQIGPVGFVFQINGQPEKVTTPVLRSPPKPKKEKKATEKPADDHAASFAEIKASESQGEKSEDSGSLSDISDILIDDSDSLKDDSNLLLDDLG